MGLRGAIRGSKGQQGAVWSGAEQRKVSRGFVGRARLRGPARNDGPAAGQGGQYESAGQYEVAWISAGFVGASVRAQGSTRL